MLKNIFITVLFGIIFGSFSVFAGSFTPVPANPGAGDYTLSDIFNKISSSTYSYSSHTFGPTDTPNSTLVTLSSIWNIIPPFITLAINDLDSGILNAGIYDLTTDLSVIEPDLVEAKISSESSLFGVEGICRRTITTEGLISYWPFDGNANDSGPADNDGTITNVVLVTGVKGVTDTAYDFDDFQNDYITFTNPNITTAYSSSVWIKPRSFPAVGQWTVYRDAMLANISLTGYNSQPVTCNYNSDGSWANTVECSTSIPLNEWTHIACTQGPNQSIFINGVLCNTTYDVPAHTRGGGTLTVGAWLGSRDYPDEYSGFDGSIDELRFYDRELSEQEVNNIYNVEKPE